MSFERPLVLDWKGLKKLGWPYSRMHSWRMMIRTMPPIHFHGLVSWAIRNAHVVWRYAQVHRIRPLKELTSLKREFPLPKEPPGQTLQQAIHDLPKGRADNQNVQIT
jgi:hypothetical protein